MAQTTPVVMAHGMEAQASVGFKSKGYAILGIQFNAIATQWCKNKIGAIGTVCMQACGSACLVSQLKRGTDLGSAPGSLDTTPAQCLSEKNQTNKANMNIEHKHNNKMRQANNHAMMNDAQFTWQVK
jgi:hypothetical protein